MRTKGEHGTAMGHHCVGHGPPRCPPRLVLHRRQSCSVVPVVMQPHHLPVTTVGSAIAWGDGGHSQAGRGHGAWGSCGPGQVVQAGMASAPGLGRGDTHDGVGTARRGTTVLCHHRGDRARGMPLSPVPPHHPKWRVQPLLPQFPQELPAPPREASDSQAGRAASGEGFINSRLGVHHSLSSLPASGEDVALDFPGKSARRGFTVSSLRESRTEAVTNGKRYVV